MKKTYLEFINESVSGSVRTRFAPSPTGALHIGGVRTALYNYLFTKKQGGEFILRIEDTDSTRFVPGAEQYIKDAFEWLGIEFDEGPDIGGSYGPYRQSERRRIYKDYSDQLVEKGLAYYAFDTAEELEKAREEIPNFSYDASTRMQMRNSLTLSPEETERLLKESKDYVVRIKYPDESINIEFNDMIRGKISINTSTLDDKVIWKRKDELPTYHLANVVDDHLMKITHVIRGEEWIPSTPLHVYLYDSFDWDKPEFAHLPLILGPSGKLSKRDGDKYGFPVYPLQWKDPKEGTVSSGYKSMGYTPEAVINILAFLGWNPGTEKEVYDLDDLINDFDLSRVNKAGAKFNPDKAAWFNGQHIKEKSIDELLDEFKEELKERGIHMGDDKAKKILEFNKNKVNFIKDIFDEADYLFEKPKSFDPKGLKKWSPKSAELLSELKTKLESLNNWYEQDIQDAFESFVKDNNIKFGEIAPQLRLVLSGKANGPSLFGIMELIGKEQSLDRLVNYDLPKSDIKPVASGGENNQEIERLQKELDGVSNALTGSEKKLSNPNFVDRAPKQVVENEKKKLEELTIKYDELKKELEKLKNN
jgi:glutamyl-tRNA synthetase